MRKIIISFIAMLLALYGTVASGSYPVKEEVPAPLSQGRADTLLQFTSGGHVLGFTPNRVYMAGMGHALTEEFIGANTVTPKSVSSHRVVYENLWKGISLTYEAKKTGIAESIYTVNPGADVNSIRIRYNAEVTIQKNGTLSFTHPTARGSYTLSPPVAWQEKEGTRIPVPISYTRLTDTTIGFTVGPYDRTLPLVIDPVYTWHTFYGSSDDDIGRGIAVDKDGNIYVTGTSYATWGSPINPHSGGEDIVVLKLNSSGTLLWHTFCGSNGDDRGRAIAVDKDGNVYVTGYSDATWGTPINPYSGNDDMVVFKLNSSGTLLWHTFYGSSDSDYGLGIAVDKDGNVYVTGTSGATWGTPITPHSGGSDMVVLKLGSSGTLLWHTFYGSNGYDSGRGIAVDKDGNVYVTGTSTATWGTPITPHGGGSDMVVLKLNSSGTLQWHTFHGSGGYDEGYGIAVDESGNVYVTGYGTATWGSPINPHSGGEDIVVLKLNSSGTLQWHTFYGSGGGDYGLGVAVDNDGNVYVTGTSYATWGTPMNPHSGYEDIVVLKLNSSGTLLWHTFHGSNNYDYGSSIAVDKDGNVYVTGTSYAAWGTPIAPYSGDSDIVVMKLSPILSPSEGTIGTRITIHGTGFGTKKGKVLINNMAAKIDKGGWTPDRITATINKPPMPTDVPHPVTVNVKKESTTVDGTFTLRRPVLDDLATTSGTYKDAITVTGKFFSTRKGKAYLMDPITGKKKNLKVASWQMDEQTGISEFTFIVPKTSKKFPAKTYHLIMGNKVGQATTTPEFTVLGP